MKLTINGEHREVAATTVLGLLEELGLNPVAIMVELNKAIVDRTGYSETILAEDDLLELVRIVGGG